MALLRSEPGSAICSSAGSMRGFGQGRSQTSKERTWISADALGTAAVAPLRIPCVHITASEVMINNDRKRANRCRRFGRYSVWNWASALKRFRTSTVPWTSDLWAFGASCAHPGTSRDHVGSFPTVRSVPSINDATWAPRRHPTIYPSTSAEELWGPCNTWFLRAYVAAFLPCVSLGHEVPTTL